MITTRVRIGSSAEEERELLGLMEIIEREEMGEVERTLGDPVS